MTCAYVGAQKPQVLIVGEAPGANEAQAGFGLVGASGDMMLNLLIEAGVLPPALLKFKTAKCTLGHMVQQNIIPSWGITNVCQERPMGNKIENFFLRKTEGKKSNAQIIKGLYVTQPLIDGYTQLRQDIADHDPDIIIALGAVALWALTGNTGKQWYPSGIVSWQGSQLYCDEDFHRPVPVLPIIHPAAILRQYTNKFITRHHLATRLIGFLEDPSYWTPPDYTFHVRPTYEEAKSWLDRIWTVGQAGPIAVDIETAKRRYITCVGFGISSRESYCIPLTTHTNDSGYWTVEQETVIRQRIRDILTESPFIVGQNYEYDREYLTREMLCKPQLWHDTWTRHHVLFPLLPGGLHYLSALYCAHHVYWKDENKESQDHGDEDLGWRYNCKDSCITLECDEAITQATAAMALTAQSQFEMDLHDAIYHMHQRGIRRDERLLHDLANWNMGEQMERTAYFTDIVGHNVESKSDKPWYNSPQQTAKLFYQWFDVRPVLNKEGRPTTGEEAFETICHREPLLKPIVQRLGEYRSLGVMNSNVLRARAPDGRWHTQYKIPGTITYRFASGKNGYDEGMNLQNVTAGDEDE